MTDAELKAINDECDADDLEFEDEANIEEAERVEAAKKAAKTAAAAAIPAKAAPSPAAPPDAPQPAPKPVLGLGRDGIFRMTDSQARDPAFCIRTQKARSTAKSIETVPE
jgi:hypothetical protein